MSTAELAKTYEPASFEGPIYQRWLDAGAFAAVPDDRDGRYVVMMPLPNVTGALHMGHAMDNVMQDLLIRWHRMQGENALWQPGTDHAGIATQAVVEKRLKELEGLTRHDVGREALVERIWAWKDEYQARIVRQQQAMGCSCDWERQRFTMDAVCSAAVRECFFKLFRDRLIYRGDRLVNWDCHLQTAVADDEVYHEAVDGHFWHLRYPILSRQPGEPEFVVVATTRPETMLGDTAVAVHPDPRAQLTRSIAAQREAVASAKEKERPAAQAELERLEQRLEQVVPGLEQLAAMARAGRKVMLPLLRREIPLIVDEWAKPELGSGCVKITPAHDPNDYDVWTRHQDAIGIINILNADGTLNDQAGKYQGLDRFAARKAVVEDLQGHELLERVEDRQIEIGHSDRSKTPIEPYLSKQWFVRMGDVPGGIRCGVGTGQAFKTPGLAQAAIDAASPAWSSATGRRVDFHPDGDRYRASYVNWLSAKRDWCISRQLWWGHRIAVWWQRFDDAEALAATVARLPKDPERLHAWIGDDDGNQHDLTDGLEQAREHPARGPYELQVCLRDESVDAVHAATLEGLGLARDPDVLDTWFSSALWPFSTLGWPDPASAGIEKGQRALGGSPSSLDYYYPGSCLVTGRDILTLWVARMVIMGLYNLGDVPFTDVFLHAKILDGKGVTMSKSKGNGIDPEDIIKRYGTDAMRYVICDMQTGMQDIRLPVQAECPTCATTVELAQAKHGRNEDGSQRIFTYICTNKDCRQEFDVLGTMQDQGIPAATILSDRFEVGKNTCNKLWNASRFALMNLGEGIGFRQLHYGEDLTCEDRWILSRLARAVDGVHGQLAAYNPSAAQAAVRDFFWNELCDWYLELIKPRVREGGASAEVAKQVLAFVLDHVLRLFHPFLPFVTEAIWAQLNAVAPVRGVTREAPASTLLIQAAWPVPGTPFIDDALEQRIDHMREVVRGFRDLRQKYNVPPSKRLPAGIKSGNGTTLAALSHHVQHMAGLERLDVGASVTKGKTAAVQVIGELELYLDDVLDPQQELDRLAKQKAKLEGQITGSEKKLGNESFTAKAPPQVVEAERKRLEELKGQLALIEQSIADLS